MEITKLFESTTTELSACDSFAYTSTLALLVSEIVFFFICFCSVVVFYTKLAVSMYEKKFLNFS